MANPSFMYDEGGNAIGVSADRQPPLVIPPEMRNLPNAPSAPAQAPLVMPKGQLPTEGQTIPGQAPLNIPGNLQRALRTTQGPSDRSVLPPANNVARPAAVAQSQAPGMPTPEQMLNDPNLLSGVGAKDIPLLRAKQFSLSQAGEKEEAQAKIDQANNLAKAEKSRTELIQKMGDEQKAAIEQHKRDIQESSPFAPTQESAKDVAQLFSLITVAAFGSGGKGKYAGMQTLASLTGAMKGYQAGQKDVYEKDIKAFEENLKVLKTHNDKVNALYEDAMKLLSTNKELGLQKIQQLIAEDNTGIAARLARSGQYKALGEALNTVTTALQAAQDKIDKRNQEFARIDYEKKKQLEVFREEQKYKEPTVYQANNKYYRFDPKAKDGKGDYVEVSGLPGGATKLGAKGESPIYQHKGERLAVEMSKALGVKMDVDTAQKLAASASYVDGLKELQKLNEGLKTASGLQVTVSDALNKYISSRAGPDGKFDVDSLNDAWSSIQEEKSFRNLSDQSKVIGKVELDTIMKNLQTKYGNRAPVAEFKTTQKVLSRGNMTSESYNQVMQNEIKSAERRATDLGFSKPQVDAAGEWLRNNADESTSAQVVQPVKKAMPTGEKLTKYTKKHPQDFGGDEEKAKAYLRTQGYE